MPQWANAENMPQPITAVQALDTSVDAGIWYTLWFDVTGAAPPPCNPVLQQALVRHLQDLLGLCEQLCCPFFGPLQYHTTKAELLAAAPSAARIQLCEPDEAEDFVPKAQLNDLLAEFGMEQGMMAQVQQLGDIAEGKGSVDTDIKDILDDQGDTDLQ
ncbi:hypothetical protein CALCODRAFT_515007 [Calocera cornea HHB12733]|uniref:Uncharacterized protein n=1 Tax=Calocera cornea HHB12733 TaxID=1353952 RepID=A0A165IXV4_9BASI|nr:hypothetical protein CALCODRAFT_515007 [Calocera cornea HHB12733]